MKTVEELIKAFTKGQDQATITIKQSSWLESLAKKEGLHEFLAGGYVVKIGQDRYFITRKKIPFAAYGGFVGSKPGNYYGIERKVLVKFDNGIKQIYDASSVDSLRKEYSFEII